MASRTDEITVKPSPDWVFVYRATVSTIFEGAAMTTWRGNVIASLEIRGCDSVTRDQSAHWSYAVAAASPLRPPTPACVTLILMTTLLTLKKIRKQIRA